MITFGEKVAVSAISFITALFYVALFLLSRYNLWLSIVLVLLLILLLVIVPRSHIQRVFWFLYAYIQIGFVGLFLVVEWYSAQALVLTLASAAAAIIALWSRRVFAPIVFVREKPLRRAVSILITLAVFGYMATGQALLIFFPNFLVPFFVHLAIAVSIGAGTYLLWNLYFKSSFKEFLLPLGVVIVLTFEANFIAGLGSAGYLVRGFGFAWLWYVLQLLIRFHFGNRDIIWARQKFFLIWNAILFILFVSVIRLL